MDFDSVYAARSWAPIRGCPGRYGLTDGAVRESPESLLGGGTGQEFRVAAARDTVVVIRFSYGGLISYRRADGSYVHTLNTDDGFARKLEQLGIQLR